MALDIVKFIKGILVKNDADTSKQVEINVSNSATTNTKTTIVASQTADRTLTLPDQTATIATDADLTAKADLDLGNLTATSINQPLIADTTDTQDLGSDLIRWDNAYINNIKDSTTDTFSINPNTRLITDAAEVTSIDYENRTLKDSTGANTVNYETSQLMTGATPKLDWGGSAIDVNTLKIQGMADPSSAQDAATKNYVDLADGNKITGPASSVDSEVVIFDGTTGKLAKRATGTGPARLTSGVLSTGNTNLASEVTGTLPIANGGTGQTSQTAAFDALAPTTTKGDIIVHDGTDNIRLAVGVDGTVLVADSTQASGLKFDAVQGVKNYIANPGADSTINGWVTYADAAQTTPVDGTGGTANITLTRTTSSPLRGAGSFLITKDAANRQGQGVSYDFTIDAADEAKVLQISLDYEIASGTFANGDIGAYIYDVTNALVIQPAGFSLSNVIGSGQLKATFQTSSNSTSYRLIFHIASTSASAYTVKYDNVIVGPQVVTQGAAMTDYVSYTPSVTNLTAASPTAKWRRVGNEMEIYAQVPVTGSSGGQISLAIPSGYSIDTTSASGARQPFGEASAFINVSPFNYTGIVLYNSATTVSITSANAATSSFWGSSTPATWSNGDTLNISFKVPIVGWSSNTQVSSDTDTRVVMARVGGTSDSYPASLTPSLIKFNTVLEDTHGAYNTSTGLYTINVPGRYRVYATTYVTSTATAATNAFDLALIKNTTAFASRYETAYTTSNVERGPSIFGEINCVAGDTIEFRGGQNLSAGTLAINNNTTRTYMIIERISGPSQIAASETVAARYTNSAGTSVAALGVIEFPTKSFDSHNAVTGSGTSWKFTAPISGTYLVSYALKSNNCTSEYNTAICKNGAAVCTQESIPSFQSGTSIYNNRAACIGTTEVKLLAGDYVTIQVTFAAGSGSLATSASLNYVDIVRTGNY